MSDWRDGQRAAIRAAETVCHEWDKSGPPPLVAGQRCWIGSPPRTDDWGYCSGLWSVTLEDRCRSCRCCDYSVFRRIAANGVAQLVGVCKGCWRLRPDAMASGDWHPSDFPIVSDLSRHSAPCERCGATSGTERHHWAPYHLFKDADDWPTSLLCRKCHTEWHRVVTPKMHSVAA